MNIGDIGAELDAVEAAHRHFNDAVEGPEMQDYASDKEAYEVLRNGASQLRDACIQVLNRLPPAASGPREEHDVQRVDYRDGHGSGNFWACRKCNKSSDWCALHPRCEAPPAASGLTPREGDTEHVAALLALRENGGTVIRAGLAAFIELTLRSMNATRAALVADNEALRAAAAPPLSLTPPEDSDGPEWRLVRIGEVGPKHGGHGSWVETDHPAVIACMGSDPACADQGCRLAAAKNGAFTFPAPALSRREITDEVRKRIASCCHIHHPKLGTDPSYSSVPFENCTWCNKVLNLLDSAPALSLTGLREQRVVCWLIESPPSGMTYIGGEAVGPGTPTTWYGRDGIAHWTKNPQKAMRFVRKQDAEACLGMLERARDSFVCEHVFIESAVDAFGDHVCKHGTALDVHCCNCHSGFIFDKDHECPEPASSALRELVEKLPQLTEKIRIARAAIDPLRDAARATLDFRKRDPLVMAIHNALDSCEAALRAAGAIDR